MQTLILTKPFSYVNYILLFILSKKIVLYIFSKKTKIVIIMEVTFQDAWRQIYYNKFYLKKVLETYKILLYQNNKKNILYIYYMVCQQYSITKLSYNLFEVFSILYISSIWDFYSIFYLATSIYYLKLIFEYKFKFANNWSNSCLSFKY